MSDGGYYRGEECISRPLVGPDDISGNSSDRSSFVRREGARNPKRLEDCLPAYRFTAEYRSFSSSRFVHREVEMHPPNKAPYDG